MLLRRFLFTNVSALCFLYRSNRLELIYLLLLLYGQFDESFHNFRCFAHVVYQHFVVLFDIDDYLDFLFDASFLDYKVFCDFLSSLVVFYVLNWNQVNFFLHGADCSSQNLIKLLSFKFKSPLDVRLKFFITSPLLGFKHFLQFAHNRLDLIFETNFIIDDFSPSHIFFFICTFPRYKAQSLSL